MRSTHLGPFILMVPRESTRTHSSGKCIDTRTAPTLAVTVSTLTPANITTQKSKYDEQVRTYYKCQVVEHALNDQMIDEIAPMYLDTLRSPNIDIINNIMADVITYLQINCE